MQGNREWLVRQHGGEFFQCMSAIFDQLLHPDVVQECGFQNFRKLRADEVLPCEINDAEFAELMGTYATFLVAARLKRSQYFMEGYPHCMVKILLGGETRATVVGQFLEDKRPAPDLAAGRPIFAPYVDNGNILAWDRLGPPGSRVRR